MILGASALGQLALGGAPSAVTTYVDLAAQIAITSAVECALSIAGQVHLAAQVTITSSVQSSITIIPAVGNDVHILAAIAMISTITASLTAAPEFPDPGVSFGISDRAGGA